MKKSLIALAVLAASGAAMAQSTVTLYGVVDANVNSTKNKTVTVTPVGYTVSGITQTGISSGGQNGSRWGMRVSEDLGGGLAAIATVEAGIEADTGATAQGGLGYGRQVFVGLSSGFGTLTLGRQYSAYDDIHGATSAQGNNSYDVSLGGVKGLSDAQALTLLNPASTRTQLAGVYNSVNKGVGAWVSYNNGRVDNSIKLKSANFSGFSGAVVYGFGEDKTATDSATYDVSAHLKYANGPVMVAVAHQENQITRNFKLKNTLFGVTYDAGFAKFFGAYNKAKFTGLDAADEYSLGATVPFGALTLVGQYAYSKSDDLGKNKGFGLEAWYDLSKRTRVYTSFAQTKKAWLDDESNNVAAIGLRHSF